MTKHTPGPWTGEYNRNAQVDGDMHVIRGIDKSLVAFASGWATDAKHETNANARLIAAAPELLDAGKKVLELRDEMNEYDRVLFIDKAIQMLRAAIAKATGEQA